MSKPKLVFGGIPIVPVGPKPKLDGINNVMAPPSVTNCKPSVHPLITSCRLNVTLSAESKVSPFKK